MSRFLTWLFGPSTSVSKTTPPARHASLSVERLESRETPSSLGVGKIGKHLAHAMSQMQHISSMHAPMRIESLADLFSRVRH